MVTISSVSNPYVFTDASFLIPFFYESTSTWALIFCWDIQIKKSITGVNDNDDQYRITLDIIF